MTEIPLEKIVSEVVSQVIARLRNENKQITGPETGTAGGNANGRPVRSERLDMSKYRSPVVTEQSLLKLHELTGEIIIPAGSVITPRARRFIKAKQLAVTFE